jgi:hypothetical protein
MLAGPAFNFRFNCEESTKMLQREEQAAGMRYHVGQHVRIVKGVDTGQRGEIIQIYPGRDRPYVVKMNDAWFVHHPEDNLAPAAEE